MINCSDAVRQLWDYLEKELAADDRDRIEEHLSFCRRCCGELEFADELRRVVKGAAVPYLPPGVASRLEEYVTHLEEGA